MKRITQFVVFAAAAVWLAACGGPAANTPASNSNANSSNSNANTAKPVAAAPTKEMLLDMEKKANEAFIKGDSAYFEGMLSDKFRMNMMGMPLDKASMVGMVKGAKCDVKTWSVEDPQVVNIDADTVVITTKGTFDGSCADEKGKSEKLPSPVRTSSVYVRNGDKWQGVFHGETLIIDPNSPPKVVAVQPPPPAKKDEKPAAAPDAGVDAMAAIEKDGWAAWKARDAKKLEELTSKNLAIVDPMGAYIPSQADVIKSWTGSQCDIKKAEVADHSGMMLSPNVGLLMFKGVAEGTCDGKKLWNLWGNSVYVKEGGTWKLAFSFSSPA